MATWLVILFAFHGLALVYLLYKVVVLALADADLVLYSKKLKPFYYDKKVVWVTGASSGSELSHLCMPNTSYSCCIVYVS